MSSRHEELRATWVAQPPLSGRLGQTLLALACLTLAGCGIGAPLDAGVLDAGVLDAGVLDAGVLDAGVLDAGRADAGSLDGGSSCSAQVSDGRLVHGSAPPLVRRDAACAGLTYGRYANQGQSNAVHLLPDFSYAGYRGGGVAIPNVAAVITLSPTAGDNRASIQAAIDSVSARAPDSDGFRGTVQLAAGRYEVSDTLLIAASGVVLRGAGQGATGTVLVATRPAQHDLIRLQGQGSGLGEIAGSRTAITTQLVPVGSRTFEVTSAAGFAVGDTVGVLRIPNQQWIDDLALGQWGWTPPAFDVAHPRRVSAIRGSTVTVDIPLVDTIESSYGGGALFKADTSGRIERCGVEDLRLESAYIGPDDESHGWNGVTLSRVRDSWVRRLTAISFGYAAVNITDESDFNTVEEVAQLDPVSVITGGRRYSFNVSSGTGNLFQRCYAREGRHNFVTGARVAGPNVWLDSVAVRAHDDEGPHHRWATGLLFDNVMSRQLHVQNRGNAGTGHGWAGAQVMFWNVRGEELRCDAPRGAMNWSVGARGSKLEGTWVPQEPFGWWESLGAAAQPRSLYLEQLEDRLGSLAVDATTTGPQRSGTVWHQLTAWAGQGRLADVDPARAALCPGLLSVEVCCSAACGSCGGSGCGSRPGGASDCCLSDIRTANRSCLTSGPPCITP